QDLAHRPCYTHRRLRWAVEWPRGACPQPEAAMSVARTVGEVLGEHVTLEVESIDRMYLNVYIPQLQRDLGVVSFFRYHRGATFASSALMAPLSGDFVSAIERFVKAEGVPLIAFQKG